MNSGIALQTLLAASTHEMKNSLGQITLFFDQLPLSDMDFPGAEAARFAVRHLDDTLSQALLLYRHGDQGIHANIDAHCPADIVEDIVVEARSLVGGKVEIRSCVGMAPDYVFFDRALVEMALFSAIHNAVAHASRRICVGVRRTDDGWLRFNVEDDGCGYPQYVLDRTPGEFLHSTNGTGLGLHFADVIAGAHRVDQKQGHVILYNDGCMGGASFSLMLPNQAGFQW